MDQEPGPPGERARPRRFRKRRDARAAADDRQRSLVVVSERMERFPADRPRDVRRGLTPLLHGHRRDARQRLAVLHQRGEIADHEDLRMARKGELRVDQDAARELIDALGADMMLVSHELEKLILYVAEKKHITLGDVETMVLAAKQRSLYELTDAISARDKTRALSVLDALLSTSEGDDAAIGHLYMLARTFRQMLVILEKNVRDSRAIWQALWQGCRLPPFAAEDVIRQARRYKSRRDLTRALKLIARADLALRSNAPSKRLVLENLVMQLCEEPKVVSTEWQQEELPV